MSGGAWNYQQFHIEETAQQVAEMIDFIGKIEHVMDWGVCGDTCSECAKNQVWNGLIAFFDKAYDGKDINPVEVLNDRESAYCEKCKAFYEKANSNKPAPKLAASPPTAV